ncbi:MULTISPECIES: helix-turn-helix transcriptional regulator [Aliivibrio]|uniref:AraC family transcriptional regulator n=1 Tax=Aliivibrio finisterrensis TaxID=511998 RepID=A0A4Q5KYD4_9GAMM|nr:MULTISPECIES: AraC family transcriptional regulator [Aliivibrio]MDD9178360.1 AraC family transcriptional regulator [Aliivibrio sp. A6]RYU54926.1 AraC family transcriptional regulator [Aliivibrio finisterrensis]RYU56602.1 AraC family transcriptional regulator [Aliivibrio finisterrensis]RYU61723.1 AraC family transcriptional regulator [Aliivibrio finisterrensis]RYU66552.1 AraC family transcriptional regulator [Aliivibrio finisterrensis]
MKPFKEHVQNVPSFDWIVREFHCRVEDNEFACSWHYHSEYELVLYLDPDEAFQGSYFAGDAIGDIHHNSLLLYGPGLPHMVAGRSVKLEKSKHHTLIIWFAHHWVERLMALIPEARNLKRLLDNSAYGLSFSPETAHKMSELLKHANTLDRHFQAIKVIEILVSLADDTKAKKLSTTPYRIKPLSDDSELNHRIERATRYIETYYGDAIKISDLCKRLHMSESSAYRMFEKHYGMSFSDHLKQYRIGKACELLASTNFPIALVAEKTGFKNISNFNRQFKELKMMTPSEFRRRFN